MATDVELDIEPDEPSSLSVEMTLERENFPLGTLLRFMPDVKLKQRVERLADVALRVDLSTPDGPQEADAALGDLRAAIAEIERGFKLPTDLANQLHKRLTGLRADFIVRGTKAVEEVGRAVYAETKRRERLAEDERRKAQEIADREARESAECAAAAAAAKNAPPQVVETLKREAATATAPPVQTVGALSSSLRRSTAVERFKARFIGTEDDWEPNPISADLCESQKKSAREFFAAVGRGEVALDYAEVNWTNVNRAASAQRTTMRMPGLEVVDVGGLRSKGRR